MQIHINYVIGIIRTKGTKRFDYYRNQYGVQLGVNLIPRKFGIFAWISKGDKQWTN